MTKNDKWDEYWQQEGDGGEVFINAKGEKPKYLSDFWSKTLKAVNAKSNVLDIACGGGSIFLDLPDEHELSLFGSDFSEQALQQAKSRIADITTLQCSSSDIPLTDHSMDYIVSQFGIEYAGNDAFVEAMRILKPSGQFTFICHAEDGYIDSVNKTMLNGAKLVNELAFIEKAVALVEALSLQSKTAIEDASMSFTAVEPILHDYSEQFPKGAHAHLYSGFRQLFSNRASYRTEDIINWLMSMKGEVDKSIVRLTEMRRAALSEQQLEQLSSKLATHGVKAFDYEPILLLDSTSPIGWKISGHK